MDIAGGAKLSRETLVDRLSTQIRQQVLTGRLDVGQALPSERELCDAFGVGRTTVREALQGLTAGGFLERRGAHLVVADAMRLPAHEVDTAALAARLSVNDVFEVRQLLEGRAVELAAKNWAEGDLDALREALEEMRVAADDAAYHAADVTFHTIIARIGKNPVLASVYEQSAHLFFKLPSFWRVFGTKSAKRRGPITGHPGHLALFEAIERRDAEEAVRLSNEMLERVQRTLVQRVKSAN